MIPRMDIDDVIKRLNVRQVHSAKVAESKWEVTTRGPKKHTTGEGKTYLEALENALNLLRGGT